MRPAGGGLSAAEALDLNDDGSTLDPQGRAVLLLAAARPDWSGEERAGAGLGERDGSLLALRVATFGPRVAGTIACPHCDATLGVTVDAEQLWFEHPPSRPEGSRELDLDIDGFAIRARTPDGPVLAAAAAAIDPFVAREVLVAGCITAVLGPDGAPCSPLELPDHVVAAVGEALTERDPQCEVRLGLECTMCGAAWQPVLDVARFLWTEVEAAAELLFDEIDALATAYGWTEEQILALPPRRRRMYADRAR